MKKLLSLSVLLVIVGTSFTACRKGEEDPWLSLRTRKARLVGEWKVDYLTDYYSSNYQDEFSTLVENGVMTQTYYYSDGSEGGSGTAVVHEYSYNFKKDGTWTSVYNVSQTQQAGIIITTTWETLRSGTWTFLRKSDDFKNRERVLLDVLTSEEITTTVTIDGGNTTSEVTNFATTFVPGEHVEIYELIRLSHKEIKWKKDDGSDRLTTNSQGSMSYISGTDLFAILTAE